MSSSDSYRSWKRPTEEEIAADIAAEHRRERRAAWIRPASVAVVLGVALLDALVVVGSAAILSVVRGKDGRPCATFWTDFARDTETGVWVLLGLVVVTLLVAALIRRPWVFVAVLVVQVIVLAVLIPKQLHTRDQFLKVGEGKLSAVAVDTGGIACTG